MMRMGIHTENAERAILYGGARTLEELINFTVLNENQYMDH